MFLRKVAESGVGTNSIRPLCNLTGRIDSSTL